MPLKRKIKKKTCFVWNFSPPKILCGRSSKSMLPFLLFPVFQRITERPGQEQTITVSTTILVLWFYTSSLISIDPLVLSALSVSKNFIDFFVKAPIFRNMVGKNFIVLKLLTKALSRHFIYIKRFLAPAISTPGMG